MARPAPRPLDDARRGLRTRHGRSEVAHPRRPHRRLDDCPRRRWARNRRARGQSSLDDATASHPSRAERVIPIAPGALELVVAHARIGDVVDAGIVLGVGDPAECIVWIPDCGCDACDSGSANELDYLDVYMNGVITGAFRRMTDGSRTITVIGDDVRTTSGFEPRRRMKSTRRSPTRPAGTSSPAPHGSARAVRLMIHRPSANDAHQPHTHAAWNAGELTRGVFDARGLSAHRRPVADHEDLLCGLTERPSSTPKCTHVPPARAPPSSVRPVRKSTHPPSARRPVCASFRSGRRSGRSRPENALEAPA